MMKGNSRRKASKKTSRGRRTTPLLVRFDNPPEIRSFGVHQAVRRMRFNCITAFDGEITYQNLLDSVLFASAAAVGYNLFIAVKVRYVEIWSQPTPVAVGTNAAALTFNGSGAGFTGDQQIHTIPSGGQNMGHMKCVPRKDCFASMFQVSSNNGVFDLTCQVGCIIDVVVDFQRPFQATAILCQNALVGATTGAVYTRGLDGVAVAASKLPSQSNLDI